MISRTRGTPIMEEITIIKTAGRLFSKIEFITVVALTALALVTVVGGRGGGADDSVAAGMTLEIICKAFVALVNAAVVFAKALVVFSNLSLTISAEIAPLPVALVVLLLINPPPVVVVVLKGSVALGVGEEEEVVATTSLSEDKLSMNNRDTRITTAVTVFIYTLFVLFMA
jgi:hypothetical protein